MWYNVADSNYHQAITHLGKKCALSIEDKTAHRIKENNKCCCKVSFSLLTVLIKCCKAKNQCLKIVIYYCSLTEAEIK